MSLEDLLYDFDAKVEEYVMENFREVQAADLGLDPRAAYRLYVNKEGIMVTTSQDRTMQYYGGFEYVGQEHRQEYGSEYVFYSAECSRVRGHLSHIFEDMQEYED